jgi:hypothetical protein
MKNLRWVPCLVLGAGVILRLKIYLQNRSLFLDEANLALNLVELNGWELFGPLRYEQYAPPLYNVLSKAGWTFFGPTEMGLRILSLIGGIASLFLLDAISRQLKLSIGLRAALLFVLAFSLFGLRYSTELKPYGQDMAWTLLLVFGALKTRLFHLRAALLWALAGTVALWMSFPSVFVLAAAGVFLILRFSDKKARLRLAGVFGVWLTAFGGLYFTLIARYLSVDPLLDYHQNHFFPLFPNSMEALERAFRLLLVPFRSQFGYTVLALGLSIVLFLLGFYRQLVKDYRTAALLFLPLLFCYLASGLEKYALQPRLLVFLLPLVLLFFGIGLENVVHRFRSKRVRLFVGLVLFLPIASVSDGLPYTYQKLEIEEMRPLLKDLNRVWQAGDRIFVDHFAVPAYRFYTQYHRDAGVYRWEKATLGTWDKSPADGLAENPDTQRLWILYGHLISREERDRASREIEELPGQATRIIQHPGVSGWLLDPP